MASVHELNGSWSVAQYPKGQSGVGDGVLETLKFIEAEVPGVVQYDLVKAGQLQNPFGGTAAALDAAWVSATDWVYRVPFDWKAGSSDRRWMLEVDGIDTFSDIWLNGELVGTTNDAYLTYRFPVKTSQLRVGGNELAVHIKAHGSMVADKVDEARRHLKHTDGLEGLLGKSLIRRYQRSFFSGSSLLNVGTSVLAIGIYRPLRLVSLPAIHILDVFITTTSISEASAEMAVYVLLESPETVAEVNVLIEVLDPDHPDAVCACAYQTVAVSHNSKTSQVAVEVPKPQLWWPNGYGKADLYTMRVSAAVGDQVIATRDASFGIRTVELRQKTPTGRDTFQLVVNGVPIFVHGTNLIPVDYLKVHGSDADYKRIFALLKVENTNLVRMWGGGAVESEAFFAEADRLGIMIWQDFYLHSNVYPDYDPEWVKLFTEECADILRRVRRHPSFVLLCGGNEQREGWDEWGWKAQIGHFYGESLIVKVIPDMLKTVLSGVPYIDNSPHGGPEAQSPAHGDGHIWGSFFNAFKDPLFVTETCWGQESYSLPATLKEVMDIDVEDYKGVGWPTKWKERTSLRLLNRFPFSGYFTVDTLSDYLRALEIEQALADHFALSQFRLNSPSNNGIVYWSFNKGGPLFQFGCVDYRLRPLISHYFVARIFQDVVVGVKRDGDLIRVVGSNKLPKSVDAEAHVVHVNLDGKVIKEWKVNVTLPSGPTKRILDIEDLYPAVVDRNREAAFARLSVGGVAVSDELLLFVPTAEVPTKGAGASITATSTRERHGLTKLELSSTKVCKMVEIKPLPDDKGAPDNIILSDNFFPLIPGFPRTIYCESLSGVGLRGTKTEIADLDGGDFVETTL